MSRSVIGLALLCAFAFSLTIPETRIAGRVVLKAPAAEEAVVTGCLKLDLNNFHVRYAIIQRGPAEAAGPVEDTCSSS